MLVRCLAMMRGGGETRHLAWARELTALGVDVDVITGAPLLGAARYPVDEVRATVGRAHVEAVVDLLPGGVVEGRAVAVERQHDEAGEAALLHELIEVGAHGSVLRGMVMGPAARCARAARAGRG